MRRLWALLGLLALSQLGLGGLMAWAGPATGLRAPRAGGAADPVGLNGAFVGMAATPDGGGYWLAASDGGVFSYGDAAFHGSAGALHLAAPIVGMAATPDGGGYWLAASDGGVFSYGDAAFHGSAGALHLAAPIVGMAATPDGGGYWLAASDGGVFSYGDAAFHGSAGALHLAAPIVGMAATPDGGGYWLAASDGGVFSYGDAAFHGTASGRPVAVASTGQGGYQVLTGDGVVSAHGPAAGGSTPAAPSTPPAPSAPGTAAAQIGVEPVPAATAGVAPTSASASSYSFLYPDGRGGSLARWDPCQPVTYAVNLADAPTFALEDAQAAVAQVSAASGVPFRFVGTTDVVPDPNSSNAYPAGVDAVIAWLSPSQFPGFASSTEAGWGGSHWQSNAGGAEVITSGYALLNGDLVRDGVLSQGFGPGYSEGHLLLHELGHMLGLGHVLDPTQVMDPVQSPGSFGAYGAGDLAGLRLLGSGGCLS